MRFLFALTLLSLGVSVVVQTAQVTPFEGQHVMILPPEVAARSPTVASIVVTDGGDPFPSVVCSPNQRGCTLRGALDQANRDGVQTVIHFSDHMIVELTRPLPTFTEDGTEIVAELGKEVHVDGKGVAGALFDITASNTRVEGLRLYGPGPNAPIIVIRGAPENVTIARNIVGDDDAPSGNCGQSDSASAGIYVNLSSDSKSQKISVIDNIVECVGGIPGNGLHVETSGTYTDSGSETRASEASENTVRFNRGHGVYLGGASGFVVARNLIYGNGDRGLLVVDFNNDIVGNSVH